MLTFDATLGGSPVVVRVPETAEDLAGVAAAFPPGRLYGLDVESTQLTDLGQWDPDFAIRTIQLATADQAWVFRLDIPAVRDSCLALLNDSRYRWCSHTDMDAISVHTLGVDIVARNVDTRSLAIMAFPVKTRKRDLKTLTTDLIGPELEQAETDLYAVFRQLWPGKGNAKRVDVHGYGWTNVPADDPTYLVYAGLDAIACRRLVDVLTPLTRAPRQLLAMEQWLAEQATRIRLRGIRVDTEQLEILRAEAEQTVATAKERFASLTDGINAQYSAGVVAWFTEHGADWNLWKGARTPTGQPSLDGVNVGRLADLPLDAAGREALTELMTVKSRLDLRTKTMGIVRHVVDGRIHPLLNPMGATTTARMSSSAPNMQNFSKRDPRMRGLFLPDPGSILVTIDFDQIELRVAAALAREPKMIETIREGGDLHSLTVDELAAVGVFISRDTAKVVNFLIVYGGGGQALHEQTGIPLAEATNIIRVWRQRYPRITALAAHMSTLRDGIRTISNRFLPPAMDGNGTPRLYANMNHYVQSSARELLVDAWQTLTDDFDRDCVWYPLHDELVMTVAEGDVEDTVADAERAMRFDFRGVPISATAVRLIDEHGVSRWMTSKAAEAVASQRVSLTTAATP